MVRCWIFLISLFCSVISFSSFSYSFQDYLIIDNANQFFEFDPGALVERALGKSRPVYPDFEANRLQEFITQAQSSLDIEIYELRSESVKESIFLALKKGVQVRILAEPDPVGNGCDAFSRFNITNNEHCEESYQFTKEFEKLAKIQKKNNKSIRSEIVYFNKNLCWDPKKSKQSFCYQHGKIVLRDEKLLLLSTGNFNSSSLCETIYHKENTCNRDFTVVIENESAVNALTEIFNLDFKVATHCDVPPKNPRSNNVIRKYTEGRCYGKEKQVDAVAHRQRVANALKTHKVNDLLTVSPISANKIIGMLKGARKSIKIHAQYLKDPDWHSAIMSALSRNVQVQLTLASFCHFNQRGGVGFIEKKTLFGPNGYISKWLDPLFHGSKGLLSLRIFNQSIPEQESGKLGYQHAKAFVVDDKVGWIGSVNGSFTSTNINREFGIFLHDPQAVSHLAEVMDFDHGNGISLQQHIPNID
ncbi:MAG: phosphatidylserine/phosphatidylglycerophosphate/cardiolipin synthase family protein [Oligoflexales bacterium]